MDFRTKIILPDYDFNINYRSFCLLIGSCFANNIGDTLYQNKFPVSFNPGGILYNPVSISNFIDKVLHQKNLKDTDLFYDNGLWYSYDFHSSFSNTDKDKCLNKINNAILSTNEFLLKADCLFISFGTAYCYYLKQSEEPVSNCHKQLPDVFTRKLLSPDDISKLWIDLINQILKKNKKLKIIFTISPIRHWKDGATNNQISKSSLFLAIKAIQDYFSERKTNIYYFPAYEILMDELRDYRYYAEDMLHPSETAIKYIWEKFQESYFDNITKDTVKKVIKIKKALNHKVFNADNKQKETFCNSALKQIESIEKLNMNICFNQEKKYFESLRDEVIP